MLSWPLLGQEMKSLRSELQEHRVKAVEGNPWVEDPKQMEDKMKQDFPTTAAQMVLTPSWCRKKIRDEELNRLENEITAENKVTFSQDYNKRRRPDHGSEQ